MGEIITILGAPANDGREKMIGEDTEALLSSIEESFNLGYSAGEFPVPVGKLCDIVLERLCGARTRTCLTSVAFYKLRHSLIEVLKVPRDIIRPSIELRTLLSRGPRRRRQWKDLEQRTGLRFPSLTHPQTLMKGILIVLLAVATDLSFVGWAGRTLFDSLMLLGRNWLFAGVLWVTALVATQPLVWALPRSCRTVGDFVNLLLAKNFSTVAGEAGGWNEKEVWKALRHLIANETSIEVSTITRYTAIPEGLNIY